MEKWWKREEEEDEDVAMKEINNKEGEAAASK